MMQASPLPAEGAEPTAAVQTAPLVSGAPEFLWTGVGVIAAIFILVTFLLMRWRAGRRARDIAANTEFFQPAGEGADITFDESAAQEIPEAPTLEEAFAEPEPKKKPGFFSGLFRKRADPEPEAVVDAPPEVIDLGGDDTHASVRIERTQRSVFASGRDPEPEPAPVADWAAIERAEKRRAEEDAERAALEARQRADNEETERRRIADEDRRRAEREAAARIDERARAREAAAFVEPAGRAAHDDIGRTLSEVEEALHAQREAIQAETRTLLDSFARRFSDRLDSLAASVEKRTALRVADAPAGPGGAGEMATIADFISRRLDEHQREVAQSLAALSRRIDLAPASLADAGRPASPAPAAPAVQLADIVRGALAPNAYEFNALLPNNRRADCLIRLQRPPGPIAVDARFPLEAWYGLRAGGADAENGFRRAALRHIVDIAERLIAPGLTADSALMFVPSEAIVADIHARFPDVVQDSYRARVWIVSPTTLMATMHTLSGVMRDAAALAGDSNDAKRALVEIERLSERIAALEAGAPRRRPALSEAPPAERVNPFRGETEEADRPARRPFPSDSAHESGDLYADHHAENDEGVEEAPRTPARPPFPLR